MSFIAGLMSLFALVFAAAPPMGLPDLSTHREVKTVVEINASAGTVWHVLTTFSAYDLWNPYIYPAAGDVVAGRQLDLTLRGGTVVHYSPTVLVAKPDEELSWGGKIPLGAIERVVTFDIQALGPHRVHFTTLERFHGVLLPLAAGVADDAATGWTAMARALRDRAELLDFARPQHPIPIHLP